MADNRILFTTSQESLSCIQARIAEYVRVCKYFPEDLRGILPQDEYERRKQSVRFKQCMDENPEMLSRIMYAERLMNPTLVDLFFAEYKDRDNG